MANSQDVARVGNDLIIILYLTKMKHLWRHPTIVMAVAIEEVG